MGRIAAPHGVRGAIKVQPHSADPGALLGHPQWWVRRRVGSADWMPYRVLAGRQHAGVLVAELSGIESREAAGALRGADVGVPREALPPPGNDEYYRTDLIGMAVVNRAGQTLGEVIEFIDTGAHPILRVATGGGSERLIPWAGPYIDRVDVDARRIDVDWVADDQAPDEPASR
jgi:16S rRNA processing protein RimM